jgi:hypothetical protein
MLRESAGNKTTSVEGRLKYIALQKRNLPAGGAISVKFQITQK